MSPSSRRSSRPRSALSGGSLDDKDDDQAEHSDDTKEHASSSFVRGRSVAAVLCSSFLNLLGFTMAGPITPALGAHFRLSSGSASFGSLTSAYPLGMLLGLFVWPRLSDRVGRRSVLATSLTGSGLGLAAQSLAVSRGASLRTFLAARALTGIFAGSGPVSKAWLADAGLRDGRLPRYLASRDAASTAAFIVGPVLGGLIFHAARGDLSSSSSSSLAFVVAVSAAASLAAAALVAAFVRDVPSSSSTSSRRENESEGVVALVEKDDEHLVACPLGRDMWSGVASVCVVSFLFNVGDSTFHAFFSALLRDGAGLDARDIGLVHTALACVSFAVSTTLASRALRSLGVVAACALGLSLVGSGLTALGAADVLGLRAAMAAAAVYYCGVPLYGPSVPTMLLRCVPSRRRGAVMGLDGAVNTVARVLAPLAAGELSRRRGTAAAFRAAGAAAFAGAAAAAVRRWAVGRGRRDARRRPTTT